MHKRTFTHFDTKPRIYCYCSGKAKIAYATRDAALEKRDKLYALHNKRHIAQNKLRAYECMHGNAWHLTSQRA